MARDGRYRPASHTNNINRHAADPRSAFAQTPPDNTAAREEKQRAAAERARAIQRVGRMQLLKRRHSRLTQEQAFAVVDGLGHVGPRGRFVPND